MGIDVGTNDNLKITFQFVNSSAVSETGSTESSNTIQNSVEAHSLSKAINLINSYTGKQVNLSHCKLIVFSEKIATNGISEEILTLINNVQIRPSSNVIISKCEAAYYLENSEPKLENLVTRYYDFFPNTAVFSGYTFDSTIGDFYNNITSNSCEPVAILGGVNQNSSPSANSNPLESSDITSGHTPISGERKSENIGLAVFKNDALVGELNAMESICFSIIENSLYSFVLTIPNPDTNNKNKYLDLNIYPDSNTKVQVKIVNGTPYITIKSSFTARISTVKSDSDYLDENSLETITYYVNEQLKNEMLNYLNRTSKDLKSDINDFGRFALSQFKTQDEFYKFDWLNNYENSAFNVELDINVKSGFLLNKV